MQKYNGQLIRQFASSITGNAASGIAVTVRRQSDGGTATLYVDNNIAGATLANPITTTSTGHFAFYAPDDVYTLAFSDSTPVQVIQLQDVAELQAQFDGAVSNAGYIPSGTFTAGATLTQANQVLSDGSSYWRWDGNYPKTVTAGSSPTPTGVSNWILVSDQALRGDLAAGSAVVKFPNGTDSAPAITFASDTNTGFFRKASDSIAVSLGGVEKATFTSVGRFGVGIESPAAKAHVVVNNDTTCGIRSTCYWTGTTASPYQNNDCTLFETFNNVVSNSLNLSWSVSAANAYNNIPAGVTDSGNRVGVYGWGVSTPVSGYNHAGTLEFQFGVWGRAGFLGVGSPTTGVVNNAIAVRGDVVSDSAGATIVTAVAGEFSANANDGDITTTYAVRASASGSTSGNNWSFHGDAGKFFNQDQSLFGSTFKESSAPIAARGASNNIEFGFADAGYGAYLGSQASSGNPFISFCAKADPTGDTFTTSGQLGFVIANNLGADSLIFSRLTNTSGSGLTPAEVYRIDQNGRVQFQGTPILPAFAPASATAAGQAGQVSWDANYIYICVGTNSWRRVATSTW